MLKLLEFVYDNMHIIFFILVMLGGIVIQINYFYEKIFFKSGDLELIKGKYKAAIEKINRENKFRWYLLLRLGYSYYMLGDFSQAIANFEEVIRLNPNHLISYKYLSLLYAETRKFEKAWVNLEKVLVLSKQKKSKRNIKEFEIADLKGWVKHCQGDTVVACELYRNADSEFGNHIEKIENQNIKRDLPLYSRKGKIYLKRSTPIFYRYGYINYDVKNFEKAKLYLEKALKYGGPENSFSIKAGKILSKIK